MDEALLVGMYEQGFTIYEIGDYLGCNRETVRMRLVKLGVKMRPRRQYQFKYDINIDSFKVIDSEESAYWLGFMFADGSVRKDGRAFSLFLKASDEEIILKFKEWLGYEGPALSNSTTLRGKVFPRKGLAITRPDVTLNLINKGCVNAKTGITEPPLGVPKHLRRHFIRGLFDGDGSVTIGFRKATPRLSISIAGDKPLLEWVADEYSSGEAGFYPPRKGRADIHYISMDGNAKPLAFLDWIYKDSEVYLKRKHELYLQWKGMKL